MKYNALCFQCQHRLSPSMSALFTVFVSVPLGRQVEDDSNESHSNVVLVGAVFVILLLLVIIIGLIICVCCVSRRRKRLQTPPASPAPHQQVAFENHGMHFYIMSVWQIFYLLYMFYVFSDWFYVEIKKNNFSIFRNLEEFTFLNKIALMII